MPSGGIAGPLMRSVVAPPSIPSRRPGITGDADPESRDSRDRRLRASTVRRPGDEPSGVATCDFFLAGIASAAMWMSRDVPRPKAPADPRRGTFGRLGP